jgi:hypothetical protein
MRSKMKIIMNLKKIIINCDACGKELKRFGALLFSPPEENYTRKWHICESCYDKILTENNMREIR